MKNDDKKVLLDVKNLKKYFQKIVTEVSGA